MTASLINAYHIVRYNQPNSYNQKFVEGKISRKRKDWSNWAAICNQKPASRWHDKVYFKCKCSLRQRLEKFQYNGRVSGRLTPEYSHSSESSAKKFLVPRKQWGGGGAELTEAGDCTEWERSALTHIYPSTCRTLLLRATKFPTTSSLGFVSFDFHSVTQQ